MRHRWERVPGIRPSDVERWICLQCGMVKRRYGRERYVWSPRDGGDAIISARTPGPCPGEPAGQ